MSEQSKRSPIQEDVAPEKLDALNLQEDDGETRVTTPLPSSDGEASTARNSAMSPQPAASQENGSGKEAARPFHASLSDEEAHTCNLSPTLATPAERPAGIKIVPQNKKMMGDKNPRNELPNEEERESTHDWKRSARSFSEEICRGEANKRIRSSSAGEASSARNSASPKNSPPRNEPIDVFVERVWTDVDTEIGFLNNIIDYNKIKGEYPFHNLEALDDFTENWLRVDVPEYEQLIHEVRKLRRKYLLTMARRGPKGDFADPLVQTAFDLAFILWGDESDKQYWLNLKYTAPQQDEASGTTSSE
ncbi:probable transcription factor At4g00610 [Corylus avellana]|uniref:probable transcription factor At4g00610 n=1 Tax=Corylus avellana TaxID=13451 RepID=UPI00286BCB06|nr:probable transcription factor At4g00610 [Corylus avellana]